MSNVPRRQVAGVTVSLGQAPVWSDEGPVLERGRLTPPASECWAWSAGPVALAYWRLWTVGSTRHMRGWFGGVDLSSVMFGAGPSRSMLWSLSRWTPDDGETWTPALLRLAGEEVAEGCLALGLDRTYGSPGSAAVALLRSLSDGKLPYVPFAQQEWCSGAVYGGRAEVWQPGEHGRCVQWDRRSTYVAHLLDPLPDARSGRWSERPNLSREGVSDAIVEVPVGIKVPPLPVRARCAEGERTIYPVGRLIGRWCHAELRAAVDRGCKIVNLGPGITWSRMDVCGPYQAFAGAVWSRRAAWPNAKRVGVSLVGRMHAGRVQRRAQPVHIEDPNLPREEIARRLRAADVLLGNNGVMGRLGPDVAIFRDDRKQWAPHVNIPAAVHVLAYARLALLEVLERNAERVIACATDGVTLKGWAPPSWPRGALVGDGLGAWRVEAEAIRAQVVGPVHYRLHLRDGGKKIRYSGVLREHAERFLKGRVVHLRTQLSMAAGHRAGEVYERSVDPLSVSITGGRILGRPCVVDLDASGCRTVVVG